MLATEKATDDADESLKLQRNVSIDFMFRGCSCPLELIMWSRLPTRAPTSLQYVLTEWSIWYGKC